MGIGDTKGISGSSGAKQTRAKRPPPYRARPALPPAPAAAKPKQLTAGSKANVRHSIIDEVTRAIGFGPEDMIAFSNVTMRHRAALHYPYWKDWGVAVISANKDLNTLTRDLRSLSAFALQVKEPLHLFVTNETRSIAPEIRALIDGDIFVFDLTRESFHLARFKPGTNQLLHDYPDAAEVASRQVLAERLARQKAVPSESKLARKYWEQHLRSDYAKRLGVKKFAAVHHAIELQVLKDYPGVFSAAELNDFSNMRGIELELTPEELKAFNRSGGFAPEPDGLKGRPTQLHNSDIRTLWDSQYKMLDAEIKQKKLRPGSAAYEAVVRRALFEMRDFIDQFRGGMFTENRSEVREQLEEAKSERAKKEAEKSKADDDQAKKRTENVSDKKAKGKPKRGKTRSPSRQFSPSRNVDGGKVRNQAQLSKGSAISNDSPTGDRSVGEKSEAVNKKAKGKQKRGKTPAKLKRIADSSHSGAGLGKEDAGNTHSKRGTGASNQGIEPAFSADGSTSIPDGKGGAPGLHTLPTDGGNFKVKLRHTPTFKFVGGFILDMVVSAVMDYLILGPYRKKIDKLTQKHISNAWQHQMWPLLEPEFRNFTKLVQQRKHDTLVPQKKRVFVEFDWAYYTKEQADDLWDVYVFFVIEGLKFFQIYDHFEPGVYRRYPFSRANKWPKLLEAYSPEQTDEDQYMWRHRHIQRILIWDPDVFVQFELMETTANDLLKDLDRLNNIREPMPALNAEYATTIQAISDSLASYQLIRAGGQIESLVIQTPVPSRDLYNAVVDLRTNLKRARKNFYGYFLVFTSEQKSLLHTYLGHKLEI